MNLTVAGIRSPVDAARRASSKDAGDASLGGVRFHEQTGFTNPGILGPLPCHNRY